MYKPTLTNLILSCILVLLLPCNCKIYQAAILFRHGARYHLNSIYDGNSTKKVWGELTPVGMRQH